MDRQKEKVNDLEDVGNIKNPQEDDDSEENGEGPDDNLNFEEPLADRQMHSDPQSVANSSEAVVDLSAGGHDATIDKPIISRDNKSILGLQWWVLQANM